MRLLVVRKNLNLRHSDGLYDIVIIRNKANIPVGGLMYNEAADWYKGGDEDDYFDDFVVYARDGKDLVLKSDQKNGIAGNVYVGTKTCTNDLYVTGKLTATEIEVKLDVFPDYVFKDDYNLLSLSQVEDHINSHGRLPGMPSEKEVVENGLNINDMQLKLVEKIEELTLHMIRLEKENKELRNKIDSVVQ